MSVLAVLLVFVVSGDDGIKLDVSTDNGVAYLWIGNASTSEIRSLDVSVTAVGYTQEHRVLSAEDEPIAPGGTKLSKLNINGFTKLEQTEIDARVVSLNGKRIAPNSLEPSTTAFAVHVDRVLDGDTLRLQDESGTVFTVSLDGVDAPESSQPFGSDATNFLRQQTIGKNLEVKIVGKDRNQLPVGLLYNQNGDLINLLMLQKGWAWHYKQNNKSDELSRAEAVAKAARVGLWSQSKRIAPWDYRNGVRVETENPVNSASTRTENSRNGVGVNARRSTMTDRIVYITEYGSKYHRDDCRSLRTSKQPIPLSRAGAYEACKICNP